MDWTHLLLYAMPIAFAAMGELVGQKSGMINIGIEGTMLFGAFFATLAAVATGSPWLGIGAGTLAGLAVCGLISRLRRRPYSLG